MPNYTKFTTSVSGGGGSPGTRKKPCYRQYTVTVEGEQAGAPFRLFFKRRDHAEALAIEVCGTIQDLCTLEKRKWTGTDWKVVV